MRYVVVGNGAAGTEAAFAVRKHDPRGDITVVTGGSRLLYYRPRLIDYLAGKAELAAFTLYKEDVYREKGIRVVLEREVDGVDPERKTVTDRTGTAYPYDRLLLATGAECFVPPVPGIERSGVYTVRNVDDCDRLRAHCGDNVRTVVLGGGLLGLEVANSLLALGQDVTVVEAYDWLLPRQLDEDAGRLLQELLAQRGMSFALGTTVSEVTGNAAVGGVVLGSGRELPAATVVVSAGIRGRDGLARKAGAAVDRGVVVDDRLATDVPDVYAAGDPVEHRGRLYGIWPAAREQGIAAGTNMAGGEAVYTGTAFATVLKVAGISLFSAGDVNDAEAETDVRRGADSYRRLFMKNGRLTGAIVLGETASVPAVRKAFAGGMTLDDLKSQLS